jgi:large subunit ribosomal protein L25
MKVKKIEVSKRDKLGKGETKRLRNQDMVPCVMYGGDSNYHFFAHENFFKKVVFSPDVYIVELNIDGDVHKALMQEIQFHPVTDKILHIDFIEVFEDKPVIATIPIELTGSSIGIKNGGKLRQKRRYLKVKGLAKDLPDRLTIDISNVDISEVIAVGDLKFNNLEILDPLRSMVVAVVSSRVAMKSMTIEEDTPEGEAAEGEAAEGESSEADEAGEESENKE